MVEVGDRVLVESEKVGSVTRSGVVTAVEDRLITVRWDSGSESVFVPSAGSLQVTGHEPPAGGADSACACRMRAMGAHPRAPSPLGRVQAATSSDFQPKVPEASRPARNP